MVWSRPRGSGAAYRQFRGKRLERGLGGDSEYGGQGLPGLIAAATVEIWNFGQHGL